MTFYVRVVPKRFAKFRGTGRNNEYFFAQWQVPVEASNAWEARAKALRVPGVARAYHALPRPLRWCKVWTPDLADRRAMTRADFHALPEPQ